MTSYHSNGVEETTESDTGKISEMRDRLQNQAKDAQEFAVETGQQINDTVQAGTEQGVRFVRENPGIALAGAVGVGVLIGLTLRGRS